MAEPLREKIMAGLLLRLKDIKTVNGYLYTLQTCERRQADLPDFPITPAVFLYEGGEDKKNDGTRVLCELEVVVVFCVESLQDQGTVANRMLSDVSKAVGSDFIVSDADSLNRSVNISEVGTDVVIGETTNQLVYVSTTFTIFYYHQHGDHTRG